jgi:ubiquinone biosynthesis protein Coq4
MRSRFETLARGGGDKGDALRLAAAIRTGDTAAAADLAALWLHAAAAAPSRLVEVYDESAEGWLGGRPNGPAVLADDLIVEIPESFWAGFWALVEDQTAGGDAGLITQRTAALAGGLAPDFRATAVSAALAYPGVSEAAADGFPEKFTLEALARAPEGSLGAEFHHLIVSNGFDLEVLDRDALGLADLPPPLDYLNARILQCHDLWHITAGYETTGLHEVAISGFQAGQFGHNYSAMFLAMVLTKMALNPMAPASLMLDVILSAWTHGRETPPLLPVNWPSLWDLSVEDIRTRLGVKAYVSPYPANLFESLRAA